jgi:hypothetical protein
VTEDFLQLEEVTALHDAAAANVCAGRESASRDVPFVPMRLGKSGGGEQAVNHVLKYAPTA